jgi:hypothetical protein
MNASCLNVFYFDRARDIAVFVIIPSGSDAAVE